MNMPCIEFQPGLTAAPALPPLIGLARLMSMAFRGEDLMPLAQTLITRALEDEHDANALMDLSTVLMLQGVREVGLNTQAQALACSRLYHLAADQPPALHLLAIMAPGDLMTNAPLAFLTERSDVALSMLYVQPGEPLPAQLPPHDVLWIAVSESDAMCGLLDDLDSACATWGSPTVNRPAGTLRTARTEACAVLQGVPGLHIPDTIRTNRLMLQQLVSGEVTPRRWLSDGDWPLIIRPVDSHAGHGLEKVDTPLALSQYLSALPDEDFYLSRFIDYASADGQYRKFRVVLVDGVPFAGHMGVSSNWIVHYLNAGMTDCAAKRAEEERFMAEFDAEFAPRHATALRGMAERIGLDYVVIDCAETPDGALLVFEVDPGAAIHSMDAPELFPYKVPAMEKVRAAFRALLRDRAAVRSAPA
jgi:glutathione synthase/RimK-type ligase-like ATP-grasp enzyme